jgi:hypothetical protein
MAIHPYLRRAAIRNQKSVANGSGESGTDRDVSRRLWLERHRIDPPIARDVNADGREDQSKSTGLKPRVEYEQHETPLPDWKVEQKRS